MHHGDLQYLRYIPVLLVRLSEGNKSTEKIDADLELDDGGY